MPVTSELDDLLRRVIGGESAATAEVTRRAATENTPRLLVAAALVGADADELLARAGRSAVTTVDRQLVSVAAAHLGQDEDRFQALVRDHLSDHPESVLASWIASLHEPKPLPATPETQEL
jgi:hypothetical protein